MEPTDKQEGKPYHTPKLIIYGDITELTESVGTAGVQDGSGKGYGKVKTS